MSEQQENNSLTRNAAARSDSIIEFAILALMASTSDRIFSLIKGFAKAFLRTNGSSGSTQQHQRPAPKNQPGSAQTRTQPRPTATSRQQSAGNGSNLTAPYPGDFRATSTVSYSPKPDGRPDPGEVVWTWVPYEEDFSQGKDRPVLLVGRAGNRLLGLMLTSKDHSNDHRGDNDYVDIGTGSWDKQGRPSEAKLDRILQINVADIRREGAVLDSDMFALVASGLKRRHGWS